MHLLKSIIDLTENEAVKSINQVVWPVETYLIDKWPDTWTSVRL